MNHEFWYLSRAAGFTAYLLLFASVALGIATSTRTGKRLFGQNAIFDIHRFLSIVALAFTAFHVYILVGDGYFNYSITQLTLPFLSPYRMWQVAAGSLALYALVIVVASFYLRQYIGYRAWRAIHYVTFFLYAGATLHGITAGSDTSQAWARGIYLVTGGVVLALLAYRLLYRVPFARPAQTVRIAAGGFAIVTAIVLVFGTGLFSSSKTSGGATTASSGATSGGAQLTFLPTFDTDMTGTYTQDASQTSSRLEMQATTDGDVALTLKIELASQRVAPTPDSEQGEAGEGTAADSEAAEARPSSQVTANVFQLIDPNSNAVVCDGKLTAFDENYARMTCTGSGPYQGVSMTIQTQFDASRDGTFSGALSGEMSRAS